MTRTGGDALFGRPLEARRFAVACATHATPLTASVRARALSQEVSGGGPHPPRIVEDAVGFLLCRGRFAQEGLFAARGGADLGAVLALKAAFEAGTGPSALTACTDARAVGSLLRLYLASLPEPLLTFRQYDAFLALATLPAPRRLSATARLLSSGAVPPGM